MLDEEGMNEEEIRWRLRELYHLQGAIRASLVQGGNWLVGKIAPTGPLMHERNLNLVYKGVWGMYASGVDHRIIMDILDWIEAESLQANGDFYFPEEPPYYKDALRAYRPLTFLKVAAWIGHRLVRNDLVIRRILQYQHKSGGVFNYIGEDPNVVEEQPWIGPLNTSFFGHLMTALDLKEPALKAGEWLLRFVQANEKPMREEKVMYTRMTPEGRLLTDVDEEDALLQTVNLVDPKQEFWQVGTTMAYLCVLYDVMRERWNHSEEEAAPYLNAALTLNDFEAMMPHYTYLWPSKCKVAWGAGELLRVLVKYGVGREEEIDKAYRAARNTVVMTFIDNQLPSGGWPCEHYPTSKHNPEYRFEYKPLKGIVNVPSKPLPDSRAVYLPPEEITGEFLGEMKSAEAGIFELISYYKSLLKRVLAGDDDPQRSKSV